MACERSYMFTYGMAWPCLDALLGLAVACCGVVDNLLTGCECPVDSASLPVPGGYTDIKLSDTDIKLTHTDIKLMNTDIKLIFLRREIHRDRSVVSFSRGCRALCASSGMTCTVCAGCSVSEPGEVIHSWV